MTRDLLAALWSASYKGVPFYVERDAERGGRRLVIHEFPNRDLPFVEDLGESARQYELTIYLVGDDYDSAADDLVAALTTSGPGALVLPVQGPVQARLHTFDRDRALDRTGYIAFRAHFVREGATDALVSVAYLAQLGFDAVAALADAAGAALGSISVLAQPSWIVAASVDGVRDIVATLDTIQADAGLDPVAASTLTASAAALYRSAATLIDPVAGLDPTLAPSIVGLAVGLADAMAPDVAIAAFGEAFDAVADPASVVAGRSPAVVIAASNAGALADLARLALLAAYVESIFGATYPDRQAGIAVRADCVERFDVVLAAAGGADQGDLFLGLLALRDAAVAFLSGLIADLAPVVTVTTDVPVPATVMAYRLYADPARAAELVARNNVAHPSFMPTRFEALAPAA